MCVASPIVLIDGWRLRAAGRFSRTQAGMPKNSAHDQPHKKAGVPGAGQFDFKNHAPATLTLDAPEAGRAPRPHYPDQHALLLSQADRRQSAVAKMLDEQDKLSMEAVSSGIRRDFPTATELRVKQHFGDRGARLNSTMTSVRDKDGNDLTEGNTSWDYKPAHEGARPISHSFSDIRARFFDYENDLGYDQDADEIIVPLDRNYAEGIELQ
jgi:hypothetical protein